jgi:hypothetical protein
VLRASSTYGFEGVDQTFAIDPRVALLAFVVNLMLFGSTAGSMGIALPVLIPLAIGSLKKLA